MCGTIFMTSFSLLDLIALILQRVQLQVKIHSKYFSCGWHGTYICNPPLQEYIACNKGTKQIMPPTANHEGWVRKAGLWLFPLRLVVGEVWFVPLKISVHFDLANAFKKSTMMVYHKCSINNCCIKHYSNRKLKNLNFRNYWNPGVQCIINFVLLCLVGFSKPHTTYKEMRLICSQHYCPVHNRRAHLNRTPPPGKALKGVTLL